jgi:hypothetical protein
MHGACGRDSPQLLARPILVKDVPSLTSSHPETATAGTTHRALSECNKTIPSPVNLAADEQNQVPDTSSNLVHLRLRKPSLRCRYARTLQINSDRTACVPFLSRSHPKDRKPCPICVYYSASLAPDCSSSVTYVAQGSASGQLVTWTGVDEPSPYMHEGLGNKWLEDDPLSIVTQTSIGKDDGRLTGPSLTRATSIMA